MHVCSSVAESFSSRPTLARNVPTTVSTAMVLRLLTSYKCTPAHACQRLPAPARASVLPSLCLQTSMHPSPHRARLQPTHTDPQARLTARTRRVQ